MVTSWAHAGGFSRIALKTPYDIEYLARTPEVDALPFDLPRYFDVAGAHIVPTSCLVSRKSDAENHDSAVNAAKFFAETYRGERPKRAPLNVSALPGGRFLIEDGNASFSAARHLGWPALPVRLVPPGTSRGASLRRLAFQCDLDRHTDPDPVEGDRPLTEFPYPGSAVVDAVLAAAEAAHPGYQDDETTLPIERVPLRGLIAMQNGANQAKIDRYAGNDAALENPIIVIRYRERLYIRDGHHRALAAVAQGKPDIPARIVRATGAEA